VQVAKLPRVSDDPPSTSSTPRILERGLARGVRLVLEPGEVEPSVVKRFASRSIAGATLDGARARREHRMLSELFARGVAVPRPLEVRRDGAAWEVRMQWLDGAQSIERVLDGEGEWPVSPERAARALGSLLASLHRCGVDHPDLHAGNALVDTSGRAWAIDFHKARRVRALSGKSLLRDLSRAAAGVRESVGPRFRARFFLAWWRALEPEQRTQLGIAADRTARSELARSIESTARARRAEVVRRRRARWLRDGTAVRAIAGGALDGFERLDAAHESASQLDQLARNAGARRQEVVCDLRDGTRALLVTGRSARDLRAIWCTAARLLEHRIAAAQPLCIALGARKWAAFELPRGAKPCNGVADLLARRRSAFELGILCAQLADRGLRPLAGAQHSIWLDERGAPCFALFADVQFDARVACGIEPVRTLALAGVAPEDLPHSARAAFAAGILRGAALGLVETRRLRNDLRHG
jgi:hypothetical protein